MSQDPFPQTPEAATVTLRFRGGFAGGPCEEAGSPYGQARPARALVIPHLVLVEDLEIADLVLRG